MRGWPNSNKVKTLIRPHAKANLVARGAFRDWVIDFGECGYVARYRLDANVRIILAVRHQKEVGF